MTTTLRAPAARSWWLVDTAKLEPPLPRRGLVRRDRIIARVEAATDARVVTVIGPAGSGKTTLVGQLARARGSAVAWVTVDEDDNDPAQLLRCITAALGGIVEIDPAVATALAAPETRAVRVLPRLTNSLRAQDRDLVLVIDDCHRLSNAHSLDVVAVLSDRMPHGSVVILSGRREPELPLARWQAEGGLLAITPKDLALNLAEAGRVCAEVGVPLAEPDLHAIVEATEGWAAGVYLTMVSLQRRGRRRAAPRAVDEADISAYIESEVLADLGEDDMEFMTRTSILGTLTGPLCDAVSGMPGSAQRLEALERRNLLVVPTDAAHRGFRYHALLRRALRRRLERADEASVAALHLTASAWLEQHGDMWHAIEHALRAGAVDTASRLIGTSFLAVYRQGGEGTLARWLDLIGESAIAADPVLPLVAAWRCVMVGEPDRADHWTGLVEDRAATARDRPELRPLLALLRATQCRDGVEAMRADADLALALVEPLSPWRPVAVVTAGLARLLAGEPTEAQALFRQVEAMDGARNTGALHMAWAEHALYAIDHRSWSEAEDLVRRHRASTRAAGVEEYQTSLLGLVAEARLAIRSGDSRRARELLARAQPVRPQLTRVMPHWAVRCLTELARTQLMADDPAGAAASIAQAEGILAARPRLGILGDDVATIRARLAVIAAATAGAGSLSPAELRILPLLQTHLSIKEMASRLGLSPNTAKTQSLSLYAKLGIRSRSEAVDRAVELGLLEPMLPPVPPRR